MHGYTLVYEYIGAIGPPGFPGKGLNFHRTPSGSSAKVNKFDKVIIDIGAKILMEK